MKDFLRQSFSRHDFSTWHTQSRNFKTSFLRALDFGFFLAVFWIYCLVTCEKWILRILNTRETVINVLKFTRKNPLLFFPSSLFYIHIFQLYYRNRFLIILYETLEKSQHKLYFSRHIFPFIFIIWLDFPSGWGIPNFSFSPPLKHL